MSIAAAAPSLPAPPGLAAPGLATTGPEGCPQGWMPGKVEFTVAEAKSVVNPLQYLPIIGTIYRAITGETLPEPLKIASSVASAAIFGGPVGAIGAVFIGLAEELIRMGPDQSRPALPEGFANNGSEGGVSPVTPGSITTPGGYTTLATTIPDFLMRPTPGTAFASNGSESGPAAGPWPGAASQAIAAYEWQRTAMAEHGAS